MRRLHLFELEDSRYCPRAVRDAATDLLGYIAGRTRPYARAVPLLRRALEEAGARRVVDLGSGGGGPWRTLHGELGVEAVLLTDLFPNADAARRLEAATNGALRFYPAPVRATRVPAGLDGFRTLFSAFHHFRPDEALAILRDAVERREGIAVLEATRRDPRSFAMVAAMPFLALALTPFVRPLRWSRLFFTYALPLVPLVMLWDGLVSCLRTYSEAELCALTARLEGAGYRWTVGTTRVPYWGVPVTYLIGVPDASAARAA